MNSCPNKRTRANVLSRFPSLKNVLKDRRCVARELRVAESYMFFGYKLCIKVAQEGHDQNFYIFLLVYLWSKFFFLPNFQERELGLCLTSSQTFGHMTPCMTVF